MAFAADYDVLFDRLDAELRQATQPAAALFAKIIGSVCTRIPILDQSSKAGRIDRLIELGAWAEAAMAMVELELPGWILRRLICEDGEWVCSLSRRPNSPIERDDTVDAGHALLPLAILRALVEARHCSKSIGPTKGSVPTVDAAQAEALSCGNFA